MLIADVLRSKGNEVVKISPADSVALAVRKRPITGSARWWSRTSG